MGIEGIVSTRWREVDMIENTVKESVKTQSWKSNDSKRV